MRLTLRTMLAYLDEVLEPAEAEDLGKKIGESDFASGLVQRIRTVSKKVRMDAPKLDGKGAGNDANAVAEYLDSTLPQDRVGDFERICLESDRHLAEVAACHQILTLVLGKPADVPEELRDKIYALGHPDRAVPPGAAAATKTGAPPVIASANGRPAPAEHADAEVPDYLRAGRGYSIWPFVGTAAAVFLLCAAILRAMGPFDNSHPVLGWLGGGTTVADANRVPDESPDPIVPPKPPAPVNDDAATAPTEPETTTPETPLPEVPRVPVEPLVEPVEPPPPAPRPVVPEDPAPETAVPAVAPKPAKPVEPAEPVPPEPGPGMDVGRYISDRQVLASYDPEDGLWYLKPTRSVLAAGERLIVLPTYRPQVALPSGVQVTFAGESLVQMEQPGESGASRMSVAYGRFIAVTVGAAGAQIDLNLAGIEGTATLIDADSGLAVKAGQWLPPGADPEAGPGIAVVELYTTNGRVTWQEKGQEKVSIPEGHVHLYVGADPPETQGPFLPPDWIDAKSISPIDRETSQVLQDLLAEEPEKPLNLSLRERLTDRRVNVRALIARCLGNLEEYEPILKDLNDAKLASFWANEAIVLQQAILHSPQTAAKVREAIERFRDKDAAILYRLVWGFDQEQLEKNGAVQLVKHLEHEEMDVRVLTFLNLIAITGAQEFYRPEKRPDQNKAAIQNWKERLLKGTIAYKTPPTPLETYKPAPKPAGIEAVPPRGIPAPRTPLEAEPE